MQQCQKTGVTLVLGGVRSGKSRYAQQLAEHYERVCFIATAECRNDAEMVAKINRHRADRPFHWTTIEEPLDIASAIESVGEESEAILIDCLTLFAANLLEASGDDQDKQRWAVDALCQVLKNTQTNIFLVSNEVGSGVVPAYASGRRFRDLVGEINQRVAAVADTVLLMIAGLPMPLKNLDAGSRQ